MKPTTYDLDIDHYENLVERKATRLRNAYAKYEKAKKALDNGEGKKNYWKLIDAELKASKLVNKAIDAEYEKINKRMAMRIKPIVPKKRKKT